MLCPRCKGDTVLKVPGGTQTCSACDGIGYASHGQMQARIAKLEAYIEELLRERKGLCEWLEARADSSYVAQEVLLGLAGGKWRREGRSES